MHLQIVYQESEAATDLEGVVQTSRNLEDWDTATGTPEVLDTQGDIRTLMIAFELEELAEFYRLAVSELETSDSSVE